MTGDLGDDRCHLFIQFETVVVDEESSDPPKTKRREEILQVEIQDVTTPLMTAGIGNDGVVPAETMRQGPSATFGVNMIAAGI